ncbi:uncharacterized protein JN550_011178 [Neoarthrinium moseri]|uniref:uncharacterized protein n=1 Tax=Neoarthrinium moseri TaxID=1658444 RepID=UPI001FDDD6E8|nr:uncharacterized protein JN550_011178 [Neoarthrinium moseri]KAI1860863.1 hypothetical protein JN550_011178 [Neoarthrinium moseri]
MESATSRKTAVIIIDVQNGFLHPTHWGTSRSTPDCERNIYRLLVAARRHNAKLQTTQEPVDKSVLICHVHHHSINFGSALHPQKKIEVGGQLVASVDPQAEMIPLKDESVWVKNVNSAFIGTGLEAFLRQQQVRQLVICGLTTDHCVSTSTRMANNLRIVDITSGDGDVVEEGGIVLVGDACATYAKGGFDAETVHKVSLASLNEEFAHVVASSEVMDKIFAI